MLTTKSIAVFMATKQAKGLSQLTLDSYQYRLGAFARYYRKLPTRPAQIEHFLAQAGPSQANRETYYRLFRNFYNVLTKRRMIKANPVLQLDPPRLPRKVARSLTLDQLGTLLHHPSHTPQIRAFLWLLADTGIRLSEALSITAGSINGHITLVDGKTGQREVPISPRVGRMVLDALPWPWASYQAAGLAVRRAFRQADLIGSRMSAHALRHTFCRQWTGDETLLQGIMGWTSLRMLRTYRPYVLERAIAQHRECGPLSHITSQLPLVV